MTFLFLLPLIYTVLGSVIVAIKTARSSKYTDKIKARDERVSVRVLELKFLTLSAYLAHECTSRCGTCRFPVMLGTALCSTGWCMAVCVFVKSLLNQYLAQ